ncbi:SURF1 family protein [Devosia sp. J2-20]|uniref:SURF1-like protein n=1 Tax=Devosia litorisediminis TaxID=2829817 RepID=A0A942E7C0_9HYPH|nr:MULTISPECIES: SURF1 family protein [Devosia]MBS3849365.1 SURF1 family protein [Devosia litorisediminis]WDQ97582.1 SURF1 family protein [Devosia sp. J2-20]
MSPQRRLGPLMTGTFVVLMLALAVVCTWLGTWQLQRLAEKEALIVAVDERLDAAPIAAPNAAQWPGLDLAELNFRPVSLTGAFRYNQTVTVFTSLANARGAASGPGYWVVTPFVLAEGGTVFVNRGFVPEALQEAAVSDSESDITQVTITGLLRPGETAGFMTPAPDTSNRVEWVRDPVRLAEMVDPALAPFAPYYVDLPAGAPNELPQGGETVIEFPNNHLGYAYTWFGFAIVAVVMLGFWLARQRAARKS